EAERDERRQKLLASGELAAEGERQRPRVGDDDLQEPQQGRVTVLEVAVDVRVVAAGGERVLGEVVRADGEEIDVARDRGNGERRRGGLDHCAERRPAG